MSEFTVTWNTWVDPFIRWIHVAAGIMWIGHLYFFNFVNAQVAKTYDAESKKKVVPELMPRALYFFRWGAMYTWVTGVLMLGFVFYMGGQLLEAESAPLSNGISSLIGFAIVLFAFFIYDALWKSPVAKNEVVAAAISWALIAGVAVLLRFALGFSYRATAIHVGATFGTIMMMNVWMRIWPSQRKIIAGIKGTGPAPDPSVPALAGLRSKHNTYMSVPLVLLMLNVHTTGFSHSPLADGIIIAAVILVGWGIAKFLFTKSATPAPTQF